MQFSAVLLFAGAALATYTKYETVIHTITHCGPEVTNCPAHSTVAHTATYAVPAPIHTTASGVPNGPYQNGTSAAPSIKPPFPTGGSPEVVTITINACPSTSPAPAPAVTVSSVVVPVEGTGTAPAPVGTASSAPSVPVSPAPAFTGAASTVSGSLALAGLVGVAALILA